MPSSVIFIFFIYAVVQVTSISIKMMANKSRIIGGEAVEIQKYPYQVSLQYIRRHHCGGAIISEIWVLTAAHCVQGDAHLFSIRAGSRSHSSDGTVHTVTSMILHNKYNTSTLDNDIAVLRVHPNLDFGTYKVHSITLAMSNRTLRPGSRALVSGWGYYESLGKREKPRNLRAVPVRVVEKRKCIKLLKPIVVTKSMLCAGNLHGGKDACKGDSGGPLVSNDILVGIVSWGYGCGVRQKPGVYTDVSYLRDWIANSSGV